MRYVGQGFEIAVDVSGASDYGNVRSGLGQAFEAAYRELYGRTIPGAEVEVLSWTLALGTQRPAPERIRPMRPERNAQPEGHVSLYDPIRSDMVQAALYWRESLAPGDACAGPALIVESQTTTVITTEFRAIVDAIGQLWLERVADAG